MTIIAILNWLDFIVVLSLDIRGNNKSTQTWNIWSVSSSKAKPANITLARVPVFTRAQQNQTQKYTYDSAVRIRLALEIILSLVLKHETVKAPRSISLPDLQEEKVNFIAAVLHQHSEWTKLSQLSRSQAYPDAELLEAKEDFGEVSITIGFSVILGDGVPRSAIWQPYYPLAAEGHATTRFYQPKTHRNIPMTLNMSKVSDSNVRAILFHAGRSALMHHTLNLCHQPRVPPQGKCSVQGLT